MSKFHVNPIAESAAEIFWETTYEASVFIKPSVLNILSYTTDWWGCYQDSTLVAVWPICRNEFGKVYTPEFTYYVGILFSNKCELQPNHRKLAYINNIYESFIQKFKLVYRSISFCTGTTSTDIRYFLWQNHKEVIGEKYILTPRYTAIISKIIESSKVDLESNFRPARRRHIKHALSQEFSITVTKKSNQINEVTKMYQSTLDRQNTSATKCTLYQIEKILQEIPEENSVCIKAYPKNSNNLAFFALIFYAKNTANLVLNLTNLDYRDTNISSLGILKCILTAKNLGCDTFDFNGANSPNRADDKHSYGAEQKLFFQIDGAF
jgi:hypothetical protein